MKLINSLRLNTIVFYATLLGILFTSNLVLGMQCSLQIVSIETRPDGSRLFINVTDTPMTDLTATLDGTLISMKTTDASGKAEFSYNGIANGPHNISIVEDANPTCTVSQSFDIEAPGTDLVDITVNNTDACANQSNGSFSVIWSSMINNLSLNGQSVAPSGQITQTGLPTGNYESVFTWPCGTNVDCVEFADGFVGEEQVSLTVDVPAMTDCSNETVTITGNVVGDPTVSTVAVSGDLTSAPVNVDPVTGNFTIVIPSVVPGIYNNVIVTATRGTPKKCSAAQTIQVAFGTCDVLLLLSKTTSKKRVPAEGCLTFTINVKNVGMNPAHGVTVTDNLPHCFKFVRGEGTDWAISQANQTVLAVLSELGAGAEASFDITVKTDCCKHKLITNTASVVSEETLIPQNGSVSICTK